MAAAGAILLRAAASTLLLVDVQERLIPHVWEWEKLLDACIWLVRVAQKLGVPVVASEQYPTGLGPTAAQLRELLPAASIVQKVHFSCVAESCLRDTPVALRPQVVVAGLESHVCVLQTALDLASSGKQVFVVADAVSSRNPDNRDLALARMRDNGLSIVSREMVAFEWLRRAGTDLFREINREFIR